MKKAFSAAVLLVLLAAALGASTDDENGAPLAAPQNNDDNDRRLQGTLPLCDFVIDNPYIWEWSCRPSTGHCASDCTAQQTSAFSGDFFLWTFSLVDAVTCETSVDYVSPYGSDTGTTYVYNPESSKYCFGRGSKAWLAPLDRCQLVGSGDSADLTSSQCPESGLAPPAPAPAPRPPPPPTPTSSAPAGCPFYKSVPTTALSSNNEWSISGTLKTSSQCQLVSDDTNCFADRSNDSNEWVAFYGTGTKLNFEITYTGGSFTKTRFAVFEGYICESLSPCIAKRNPTFSVLFPLRGLPTEIGKRYFVRIDTYPCEGTQDIDYTFRIWKTVTRPPTPQPVIEPTSKPTGEPSVEPTEEPGDKDEDASDDDVDASPSDSSSSSTQVGSIFDVVHNVVVVEEEEEKEEEEKTTTNSPTLKPTPKPM